MKSCRPEVYAFLKKEPQSLAKLKHPNILGLVEPLREDDKSLVFVTEPVENSMITMVKEQDLALFESEL